MKALSNFHFFFLQFHLGNLISPEKSAKYTTVYRVGGKKLNPTTRFKISAPKTVRTSISRPVKNDALLHLHFVNYNRTEPAKPKSAGRGIHDEKPIAAENVSFSMKLKPGKTLNRVLFLTPETDRVQDLTVTTDGTKATIKVPKFLVYGVVELEVK